MRPHAFFKRLLDLVVSAVVLLILSPLLLLIAAAVRLTSPGPALFRQRRLGQDQVPFSIYKFRTMMHNAPDLRNPDGSTLSGDDDPRITRLGRLLRRTSLDELPQFLNVLKGEMSLVGPRPDPVNVTDLYRPKDFARLSVKPGLTGWAAIHGRNDIPWERRRDLDLEYVRRHSFWLDLTILLRTVPLFLTGRGVFGNAAAAQGINQPAVDQP
jgi:lipopolysaccharide/colanic/teichoic acid biosynthesis glycosyltransferase